MKTQPRQHTYISNKYNACTAVSSPVYIGSNVASSGTALLISLVRNFNKSIFLPFDMSNTAVWVANSVDPDQTRSSRLI